MVQVHVDRLIAASPERVFAWLAEPANLAAAPLIVKAGWVTGSASGVGALRKATGIGMSFREKITAYDPPHSYSYVIVGSFPPFDHDGGTLTFTPTGGGAHVDWITTYTHPARAGGKLLEMVSAPLLRSSFSAILAGCATALEGIDG